LFFADVALAEPDPLILLKGVEAERMKYEPIQVNFTTEYVKGNDFETIIISRFTKLSN
jgi:hypothetical protein